MESKNPEALVLRFFRVQIQRAGASGGGEACILEWGLHKALALQEQLKTYGVDLSR